MKVVRTMLDAAVDPNSRTDTGLTPLMMAARAGHVGAVRLLIARGADVGACDSQGRTALTFAEEEGYPNVLAVLRKSGAGREAAR